MNRRLKVVLLTTNALCFGGIFVLLAQGIVNPATLLLAAGAGLSTAGLAIHLAR
jgi:hypothetical protein